MDCAQIDGQVVRLQEIADVADKFIRVRLVRIAGSDLRLFDFDRDLTWYCFLLNADEHVYGRYGGRDASDPHARISLKGLRYAMEQALEAHKNPPKPKPRSEKSLRAEDYPAAKRHQGCIHCHNVNEFHRAEQKALGKWSRDEVWVYPLPENVGITLDVNVGNLVKSIQPNSPAEKVGVKPGDLIKSINDNPVASFADAIYGLHKAPKAGEIPIAWRRDGREQTGKLEVVEGWRRTNVTWRPSMLDILPSMPLSGDDLKPDEKKALGIPEKRIAFRQDKFVHSTLKAIGLLKDDVVVGIDNRESDGTMDDFLAYVRRNYLVGDRVTLNIVREGKKLDLPMTLK